MAAKALELLLEALPRVRRLAILLDVANPVNAEVTRQAEAAAGSLGLEAFPVAIRRAEDIVPAFDRLEERAFCYRQRPGAEQHCFHQHFGGGRAAADDLHRKGIRAGRR